jgi:hypothetical protein
MNKSILEITEEDFKILEDLVETVEKMDIHELTRKDALVYWKLKEFYYLLKKEREASDNVKQSHFSDRREL